VCEELMSSGRTLYMMWKQSLMLQNMRLLQGPTLSLSWEGLSVWCLVKISLRLILFDI